MRKVRGPIWGCIDGLYLNMGCLFWFSSCCSGKESGLVFLPLNYFLLYYCWKQKRTVLVSCHLNKRVFITFNQLLWQECWTRQWWLSSQVPVRLFWPPENSFSVYAAYMSGVWPSGVRPAENHRPSRCCWDACRVTCFLPLVTLPLSSSLGYGFFRTECYTQNHSHSSVTHWLIQLRATLTPLSAMGTKVTKTTPGWN